MTAKLSVSLLTEASATGDPLEWPGGDGRVELSGTVGGSTVTLQVRDSDGVTYHAVGSDTTFTATGSAGFKLEAGAMIRMLVAGGSPSGLNSTAFRI